jgi:prevent-host-death family protein
MKIENINVYSLQANISKILKQSEKGTIFEVMRYSKPVAVLVSYKNYLKLRGECKQCIEDLRKLIK